MMKSFYKKFSFTAVTTISILLAATLSVQSDAPEISFDGLHLEESKKVAVLYAKPDDDFSIYKRIIMLKTYVAFRKDWQRETKVSGRRVSNKQMEKIKLEVADLFHETFKEQMEADNGYPMVTEAGDDVLIIRPAIIDLDITAPDIPVAGRTTTYVASAGAATLYLELFDSVSGEILARVIDRKAMRNYGNMQWSNSVTNRQEGKRLFIRWANMLREGLDEVHQEKFEEAK
jgi:hypothetical protein